MDGRECLALIQVYTRSLIARTFHAEGSKSRRPPILGLNLSSQRRVNSESSSMHPLPPGAEAQNFCHGKMQAIKQRSQKLFLRELNLFGRNLKRSSSQEWWRSNEEFGNEQFTNCWYLNKSNKKNGRPTTLNGENQGKLQLRQALLGLA